MAVTEQAIETIKAMIVSGQLQPGQRLPTEHELSELLGLSRNSLREAIKALEIVRILDVRRGDGTYVTSLAPDLLLEAMSFVVDLHRDHSVVEMFQVRKVLESYFAGEAATRITEEQLGELEATFPVTSEDPTVEELVAHDLEFHRLIVTAGGNNYLVSLLDGLSGSTVRARVWRGLTEDRAVARTLDEHHQIYAALRDHDADRARAWMLVHVGGIESWLRQAMDA